MRGRKVPWNPSAESRLLVNVESLVRRAQRGDASALEQLIEELAPYVGRICGSIALNSGEDALQEALISVVRHLSSLRDPAAIHGWVRTIAVREAVRIARRQQPELVDPTELEQLAHADIHTSDVEIREILAQLPPHHRAVLVLREVDGLSEAETAVVLNVSLGTVKSRTARARSAFIRRWNA